MGIFLLFIVVVISLNRGLILVHVHPDRPLTSGVESPRQPFEVTIRNNTHNCFGPQWLVSTCFSEGRSRFDVLFRQVRD